MMKQSNSKINETYIPAADFYDKNKSILGTFTATTIKRNFLYKIVIEKESFLPLQVIQTNNVELNDYLLTTFSNIATNTNTLPELSWYYSTYTSDYKPASEKTISLIKKNTIAPVWQ
ncbi:MAG: hypothetical protein WKF85_10895 [Chitinophagaceae bacterium]